MMVNDVTIWMGDCDIDMTIREDDTHHYIPITSKTAGLGFKKQTNNKPLYLMSYKHYLIRLESK